MKILLTGGLGFIGSHTAYVLNTCNYKVVIVDNLSTSNIKVFNTLQTLCPNPDSLVFYEGNVMDEVFMENVFQKETPEAVIHFASLKAVNESIAKPLMYYRQNINGLITLLTIMEKYQCNRIVFSSSATVYGKQTSPIKEDCQVGVGITNPYGQTKYFQECILQDCAKINPKINVLILRYFNPAGAHPSGLIGEDPKGIPNNLFPFVMRVASREYPKLQIFGNDYNTPDGTCVRDFIHVMDLAEGHVAALKQELPGCHVYNLGTGRGCSVMELVNTFEKVNNMQIPYQFQDRREGDIEEVYSDASKAKLELGWETKRTIEDICRDGCLFAMKV
jgi:UDP-glucose 4-epimerase